MSRLTLSFYRDRLVFSVLLELLDRLDRKVTKAFGESSGKLLQILTSELILKYELNFKGRRETKERWDSRVCVVIRASKETRALLEHLVLLVLMVWMAKKDIQVLN